MKNEMYYGCENEYSSFESFSEAVEQYMNYYNNERTKRKQNGCPP